jgi:hypothetical protein
MDPVATSRPVFTCGKPTGAAAGTRSSVANRRMTANGGISNRHSGESIIVPRRTNIAHLHRPWRAGKACAESAGTVAARFPKATSNRARPSNAPASLRPIAEWKRSNRQTAHIRHHARTRFTILRSSWLAMDLTLGFTRDGCERLGMCKVEIQS